MKVAGFSFIKDAILYDYPVVEAILSILPICDHFFVAVGKSKDQTLDLIRNIHPEKITIIETEWDESLRAGGEVLARETDKAFQVIPAEYQWCFYIQGDEIVHEKYLTPIRLAMANNLHETMVDGLLFNYLHFYGSYDYIATASTFYKKEIRIIRNNKKIYSYRDAQGFRKGENEKLKVVAIDAYIYHYGWVKQPKAMQDKQLNFNKYWHDDQWIEKNIAPANEFDYGNIQSLNKFNETHPEVMQKRIDSLNWTFDYDLSRNKMTIKDVFKNLAWKFFKVDINYKNYLLLK